MQMQFETDLIRIYFKKRAWGRGEYKNKWRKSWLIAYWMNSNGPFEFLNLPSIVRDISVFYFLSLSFSLFSLAHFRYAAPSPLFLCRSFPTFLFSLWIPQCLKTRNWIWNAGYCDEGLDMVDGSMQASEQAKWTLNHMIVTVSAYIFPNIFEYL